MVLRIISIAAQREGIDDLLRNTNAIYANLIHGRVSVD